MTSGAADLDPAAAGALDGDAPVEHEMQRLDHLTFLGQRASHFVAHLATEAGDAEELVDRHEIEEPDAAEAIGQLHRGERLLPQYAAPLRRHPLRGQRPGCGLEHPPVLGRPVLQHVLEIAGQRPQLAGLDELDCRGRDLLTLVVDQLRERVLEIALPGAEEAVALANAFG